MKLMRKNMCSLWGWLLGKSDWLVFEEEKGMEEEKEREGKEKKRILLCIEPELPKEKKVYYAYVRT